MNTKELHQYFERVILEMKDVPSVDELSKITGIGVNFMRKFCEGRVEHTPWRLQMKIKKWVMRQDELNRLEKENTPGK